PPTDAADCVADDVPIAAPTTMAAAAISKQSAAPISKARRPKRGAASPFGYQRATTKTFIRNSIGQWAKLPRDDAAVIDPAVSLCHTKTTGPGRIRARHFLRA